MNDEITRINHLILNSPPVIEICRLVGISFLNGQNYNHPIGLTIRAIESYHRQNDEQGKLLQITKIERWTKLLQSIENYDGKLLENFRKIIQKVTVEEFFGIILELAVTNRLIKEKIDFKKHESPDFNLFFNKNQLFIECTSAHITHPVSTNRDPKKKIKFAINKKTKKSYCKNNTALFIDITNLYFHNSFSGSNNFDREEVRGYTKNYLQKTNFGSVILFAFLVDFNKMMWYYNYVRIDNNNISIPLKNFLDKLYPFGTFFTKQVVFPGQP